MSTPNWQLDMCYERPIRKRYLPLAERERLMVARLDQMRLDRRPHRELRAARIELARLRGRHTDAEWLALVEEFDHRCVRCWRGECHLDRDHIIPVYRVVTEPACSDAISNIQPLCARCNSSKGPEDTNWVEIRRRRGFDG